MTKWAVILVGTAGLFWLTGSTCTASYTQSELQGEERKLDASASREEKIDREIGDQGGQGEQAIDQDVDGIDGGSAPDD